MSSSHHLALHQYSNSPATNAAIERNNLLHRMGRRRLASSNYGSSSLSFPEQGSLSRQYNGRRKGLLQTVITASICTEDLTTVSTEPLLKKDLVNYFASDCKPKEKWRIGTEHEKFGYELASAMPIRYEQIARLLEEIAQRYNWDRIMHNGLIFGLRKDGASITLEGGGQVELSGAPLLNLHQTADELDSYFTQIKDVAQDMGLGFLACGAHPDWPVHAIPIMPTDKLRIMLDCYSKAGTTGQELILGTCTVQVNLDYSSEGDMVKKLKVAMALQPIATALFANSPFTNGKPNGFVSYRSELYKDADVKRMGVQMGVLSFVFDDNFGFEDYVDYALNVPMYYAYRKKRFHNCYGMSFKDYIGGKLPNLPGQKATLKDWQNHLVQIFPEVRLKPYLEMRGADVGPRAHLCALPAFWVGLLYDERSLHAALRMIDDWTAMECQVLRDNVTTQGLWTPFRGIALKELAQDVVKLAKEGLQRRGWNEARYLDGLSEIARTGMTSADKLLDLYNGEWKGNVDGIFGQLLI